MLASILLALICTVGALQASNLMHQRARVLRMAEMYDPAAFFEEEPPKTWASPEWRWGSADGEAHNVAMRLREEFGKPHRRSAMVTYAKMGAVDFFDLKMALALSCQRARDFGYDESDGRWEALMEEMAACEFESEGMIDQPKLAAAVNKRIPSPIDDAILKENPAGVIAEGLVHLGFVEKGL